MDSPMLAEPYRSILNCLSEGVCAVNTALQIGCFNLQAERLTGIESQKALGKGLDSVFHDQAPDWTALVQQVLDTARPMQAISKYIHHVQGERIPVNVNAAPVFDDEGAVMGVVLTLLDNRAVEFLRRELRHEHTFGDIVTKDKRLLGILDILPNVAESGSPVLILGPTGTGKELFARAIHAASPRRGGPFVAINCGALPDTLLESELFGYKKGAFTDAKHDKPGRFALAKGGTLFLDEVGDLSPAMQVKLMRVLQEKQYEPLGATASETADIRVISATNRLLSDMMAKGTFRPDLYYRLNVIEFSLPPLAERPGDIPLLVEHFVDTLNAEKGRNIQRISQAAMRLLMRYSFPGNVRELRNIIERAYILCRFDEIREECLQNSFSAAPAFLPLSPPDRASFPLHRFSGEEQAALIRKALTENDGRRDLTARALGIDRTTLWRKMRQFSIALPNKK